MSCACQLRCLALREVILRTARRSDPRSLLLRWRTETSYVIQWKGLAVEQATFRGVRQGRRGTPYFWASFITLVFNRVAEEASTPWMRQCCAFYADDGHACFLFHDYHERGPFCFGKLISVLEQLGLTVNIEHQKIGCVLRWGGSQHQQARKHFVKRKLDHQVLCIPSEKGTCHEIPIKEKHEYLGIQRDTMKVRLHACKTRYKQMHRWFPKNTMHPAQKVALWQSCVLFIGIYGLDVSFRFFPRQW